MECEEADFEVVTDKPDPDFCKLAAAALDNAGIDPANRFCAARDVAAAAAATRFEPTLVKADNDEIVYKITFDLLTCLMLVWESFLWTPPLHPPTTGPFLMSIMTWLL